MSLYNICYIELIIAMEESSKKLKVKSKKEEEPQIHADRRRFQFFTTKTLRHEEKRIFTVEGAEGFSCRFRQLTQMHKNLTIKGLQFTVDGLQLGSRV